MKKLMTCASFCFLSFLSLYSMEKEQAKQDPQPENALIGLANTAEIVERLDTVIRNLDAHTACLRAQNTLLRTLLDDLELPEAVAIEKLQATLGSYSPEDHERLILSIHALDEPLRSQLMEAYLEVLNCLKRN